MRQLFLIVCLAGLGLIPFAPVRQVSAGPLPVSGIYGPDGRPRLSQSDDSERVRFEKSFRNSDAALYYADTTGKLWFLCPVIGLKPEPYSGRIGLDLLNGRIGLGLFSTVQIDPDVPSSCVMVVQELLRSDLFQGFYVNFDDKSNNWNFYPVNRVDSHMTPTRHDGDFRKGPLFFELKDGFSSVHPESMTDPVVPVVRSEPDRDQYVLLRSGIRLFLFLAGMVSLGGLMVMLITAISRDDTRIPVSVQAQVVSNVSAPPQLSVRPQIDQTLARIRAIDEAARERSVLIERHGSLVRSELDRLSTNDAPREERERLVRQIVDLDPAMDGDAIEALIKGPAEPQA